ncbi:MAG: hypothetical protein JXR78_14940, partial [Victivallales bacterium]|nr:hypothetical protein [Victivallales bacterium]
MTGTELVNIIKSPTAKVLILGTAIITGALILIPMLNRDDEPGAVAQQTELKQEEKAPFEISTGIPRFKLEKRHGNSNPMSSETLEVTPPVIDAENPQNPGDEHKINLPEPSSKAPETIEKKQETRNKHVSGNHSRTTFTGTRNEPRQYGGRGVNAPSKIFIMSDTANGSSENSQEKTFLSKRYTPFGRLLDCKLVNTLESNIEGTPLIALVIKDLWWMN